MEFKEVCERLLGACQKVSGSWSLEEGLSALAHVAYSLLKPQAVAIVLLADDQPHLKVMGSRGLSAGFINHHQMLPEDPAIQRVVVGQEDVLIGRIDPAHPRVGALRMEIEQGSLLATPVVAMGRPIGLIVATSAAEDYFTDDHLLVLQLISRIAGTCHGRCSLYDERRRLRALDPATGIWSFEYFCTRFTDEIARSRRHGEPLSLMLVDIDHFVGYKKVHGEQAADELFRLFVEVVRGEIRGIDFLGRFSLDDLLVALPGTDSDGAAKVGQRILEAVRSATFPAVESGVTVSIGVVTLGGSDDNIGLLLERAQRALYSAQLQGNDCLKTEIAE
ncbi:MAG: diguanylate cyclase [Anaerolineaceae bacterium]|nr:diguanylate cyclase [Anaerolineaceae bacterium]